MVKTKRKVREYDNRKNKSLSEIWSGIMDGHIDDLSMLFCSSYSWLLKYGLQIVPNEVLVKDAIQDLFIIIWESRYAIKEADSVESYLCSSLKRLLLRRMKKQENRKKRNYSYQQDLKEGTDTIQQFIIHYEIDQEKKQKLTIALKALRNRQRQAIHLKFYDGLSTSEIAQVMGINIQSVYNHVSNAINKMQNVVR